MNRPQRYLYRMIFILVVVAGACAALFPSLRLAFMANEGLNGIIVGVMFFGIAYSFRQVLSLRPEVAWLDRLRVESSGGLIFPGEIEEKRPPRLLGPMAKMMGERKGKVSLSTMSMRVLMDSIGTRIEESHEISRYLIGLLIFLGLLGTFWGLLNTVNAVGQTIAGLSGTGDPTVIFEDLKEGLEAPLSGMGTAFSSSLFGLAGSLVLGILELQAAQAHNRFMNDLEEWLSGVTRLSGGGPVGDGDQSVPAYIQALLEQTADSLDSLQRVVARGEDDRTTANKNIANLTDRLGTLTDQMRTEQSVMLRLAETHANLQPLLAKIADVDPTASGMDEATRAHIRNLDIYMERLVNDASSGRDHMVQEIRSEIRLLARTIAAIAEEGG